MDIEVSTFTGGEIKVKDKSLKEHHYKHTRTYKNLSFSVFFELLCESKNMKEKFKHKKTA